IPEWRAIRWYYRLASLLAVRGDDINWPLLAAVTYPVYAQFDQAVYQRFKRPVAAGAFDVVHAFTPVTPRFPVSIVRACARTPFIVGPVNGGLPYPSGFADIARREHDHFNVLRAVSRFLPGYRATYENAQRVLVGSTYTLKVLERIFRFKPAQAVLFYENG